MRRYVLRAGLSLAAGLSVYATQADAADQVEIPVLAHAVARGDIVSAADFELKSTPAAQGVGILMPIAAAGREAARSLSAGLPVRPADLISPRLVRRGEPVTIVWRSGGLAITSSGRALTSGGQGDFVRVVTASTNRTLDAIVSGSSAVTVQ